MTRAEIKALDREIPWRELITHPPEILYNYYEAIHKEAAKWNKFAPIRPLSKAEAEAVRRNPASRRRILKARAAYRDKNCGVGEVAAKCRMVLVGCNEPNLQDLQRNTPTATRLSFFFLLQVCASSFRHGQRWSLVTGDVEAAFLQGKKDDGTEPLMGRPSDPLLAATGCWQNFDLAEIVGNIYYGRANAPWLWLKEVVRRMHSHGFVSHSLDLQCFLHYHA